MKGSITQFLSHIISDDFGRNLQIKIPERINLNREILATPALHFHIKQVLGFN